MDCGRNRGEIQAKMAFKKDDKKGHFSNKYAILVFLLNAKMT